MSKIHPYSSLSSHTYSISADGTVLAIVERESEYIKFWDLLERRWLHAHALPARDERVQPHALVFLPDSHRIIIYQGSHLYTMNVQDGAIDTDIHISDIDDLLESQRGVMEVLLSPVGDLAVILGKFYCAAVSLREQAVLFYQKTFCTVSHMQQKNRKKYEKDKELNTTFVSGACGVSSDLRYVFATTAPPAETRWSSSWATEYVRVNFAVAVFDVNARATLREYHHRNFTNHELHSCSFEQMYPYKDGVWWNGVYASGPNEELIPTTENPRERNESSSEQSSGRDTGTAKAYTSILCECSFCDPTGTRYLLSSVSKKEAVVRARVPLLLRHARASIDNPRRATAILHLCLALALETPVLDKVHECRALLVLLAIDEGRPTSYFADHVAELGAFLSATFTNDDYSWTLSRSFHALRRDQAVLLSMKLAYSALVASGCEEVDVFSNVSSHELLSEAEFSGMISAIFACTERGSRVKVINMTKNRALCDETLPKFLDTLQTVSKIHRLQSPLRDIVVAPGALRRANAERLAAAVTEYPRGAGPILQIPELETVMPDMQMKYGDMEMALAGDSAQLVRSGPLYDVYRAVVNGDAVAAVSKVRCCDDPRPAVTALQREISVLTTLPRHANIVELTKIAIDPRGIAMIQPFPESSVRDCIAEESVTDVQQWLRILIGAARGLVYLHSHGIEHRALSPSTILVFPDNRAVLSGFGSSKTHSLMVMREKNDQDNDTEHCSTDILVYRSPEALVRNDEQRKYLLSTKSDIWSFGLIINEVFALQAPYSGEVAESELADFLYSKVALGDYVPSPHAALPSENLRQIVAKCLQYDPTKRPSAQDILVALSDDLCGTTEEILQGRA